MILLCYDGSEDARAAISHTGELLGGQPTTSRLFNHSTVTQKERRRATTDPPSATTILLRVETAAHAQRPRRAPDRRNAIATLGELGRGTASGMKILVVGAGVIGTVYGAQLGAAGHAVSVLAHGARTDEVARQGLRARDVVANAATDSPVAVLNQSDGETFDLVLVALRRDHFLSAAAQLAPLSGSPAVLFFRNNPDGRAGLPADLPGPTFLGFPGCRRHNEAGVADYALIAQQPTALEKAGYRRLDSFHRALESRGFAVRPTADMSGWLAYHTVFVASVCAALYHCQTDPQRLARDREQLSLMCRAIPEGFSALRKQGVLGLPRNLALLHARPMLPVAVRYWARSMRSPMGELAFAAHARRAEPEMRALARDVLGRLCHDDLQDAPRELLGAPG
jgi:2-dehydropantoate 2-reductase